MPGSHKVAQEDIRTPNPTNENNSVQSTLYFANLEKHRVAPAIRAPSKRHDPHALQNQVFTPKPSLYSETSRQLYRSHKGVLQKHRPQVQRLIVRLRPRKGIPSRFLPKEEKIDQKFGKSKKHHPDRYRPKFPSHNAWGGARQPDLDKHLKKVSMLPARYGHEKNDLLPSRTAYFFLGQISPRFTWSGNSFRNLSGPPVSTESTLARPYLSTGKGLETASILVFCDGLAQVLSMLTGGPDKV